jgi:hypothetical protein
MLAARQLRVPVVAAAFAASLLAPSLVGCGDTVIDDAKAEDAVQASLEGSLHEKIVDVDCPSGQPVEAGQTFTCTVRLSSDKQAIATLEIRNKDADVSLVGLKANK